mgnify:CR=1 FL=1
MEEYGAWLQSECTRSVIKSINELIEEIKEVVTNGSLLQEKDTSKISLDFTLALGQIEGLRMAVDTIKDIKSILEEHDGD